MSLLKKSENKMAYSKVGIYGEAGSGKTVTASKIAIGLHKKINSSKPIVFFDTEPAASFVKPLFDNAGIELLVADESRALADLMLFIDEAEKVSDIAIIDSISHIWKDAQKSYLERINNIRRENAKKRNWTFKPVTQIEFQDWRFIKDEWSKFTDRYLSSKMHMFVLGRAGTIYEYQENERTGKKELIQGGTKMATEKELAYEPSLLIEMSKIVGSEKALLNRAFVEKDRNVSNPLTGWSFDMPDFDDFLPHFNFYNIGGSHFNSMDERNSQSLYKDVDAESFSNEKTQRQIQCEIIKDLFVKNKCDGTGKDAKEIRSKVMNEIFGHGSWTKIETTNSSILKEKINCLTNYFENNNGNEKMLN